MQFRAPTPSMHTKLSHLSRSDSLLLNLCILIEYEAANRDGVILGAAARERLTVINLPMQGPQTGDKDMVEVHVLGLQCYALRVMLCQVLMAHDVSARPSICIRALDLLRIASQE